ncbi:hypothetical protein [Acinetobacter baumannii]|uniref:hypothetical protein n=1 Tax=Acinetobacter baumannii TaxID=470 RepID=UPI000B8C9511|nr:hypothetical protein [Acinetobacter baumannii]MBA2960238.1 hypothetical protein [Acinetobacter baumannii]MBA2976563.1 hypothetical protein [Acinetobacter baumannii]MCJ1637045.1 hypothetical protein [Acinetobacter baumannii]MCJ8943010.1 hypothetical protein [Acinetobacter baumannii]MCJ9115376.1 hypothetical protein [Acinetobacter baumannii]
MTMTNEQIEMEINKLKSQLTQKADVASVNTLANRVTNVENTNASQSTSISTLTSRMNNAEGVNVTQGNSINSLNSRVTNLENKVG